MLLTIIAATTLLVTGLVITFLWRVPEGAACPRCGAVTRRAATREGPAAGRHLDRWTVTRRCPACHWRGRARFAGEPQSIRPDRQSRGSA